MKRWICAIVSFVMIVSLCMVAVGAETAGEHRVFTQVLGEGLVIPDDTTVPHGGSLRLYFYPDEGYETVMVYLNGYPLTYALSLKDHCETCNGCDTCSWIDWEVVKNMLGEDDWSEWKLYVDLEDVCADKLIVVEFAKKKSSPEAEIPETDPLQEYADLDPDQWYADAAAYVLANGLMVGSNGKFDPNGTMTRAMVVTVLWRLEGKPAVKYDAKFTDVAANSWYMDAVCWAAANEIVKGSGTNFAPNDPVTREQLAAILWRYAKYKDIDVSVGENTNILSYEDAFDVSDWAYAPLQWTCGAGILNGANGYLMPQGQATRIQTAAMLYRFLAD